MLGGTFLGNANESASKQWENPFGEAMDIGGVAENVSQMRNLAEEAAMPRSSQELLTCRER